MTQLLDDILARLEAMPEDDREELVKLAVGATQHMKWIPNPGPQHDAYFSEADILLFGGQAAGGKTDLSLGLAFTAHRRSLIMRRKYTNLTGLTARAIKINGTRKGFNGSPPPSLTTDDGRFIQFGANQRLGDEEDWQGIPFDLKCFDEATQLLEQQIRFHIGWLRDAENPEQRTRAVLATNPPIDASGDWVIGMFRPWLDLTHPNPAEHGALRWFITVEDGDNVQDIEIDEVDLGRDDNGNRFVQRDGKDYQAMSRTFIPSTLDDNPYLARTNYRAQLDSLPEPIRSAVRDGNFMAARSDAEFQVIPTQWVIEAQNRWTPDGWKQFQMTCIAVDPAGGGKDAEEVCARHGPWFGEPTTNRGPETANSQSAMTTIGMQRTDGCPVIVDVGGGYGDKIVQRLDDNSIPHVKFNNAGQGIGKALNTNLKFYNKRAQAHWRLREALDPDRPGGSEICLPPGPEVRADLTAVTYDPEEIDRNFTIKLESKQKLKERIGRSPGKGDVIVMAHAEGQEVVKRGVRNSSSMSRQTHAKVGHSKRKAKRRRT